MGSRPQLSRIWLGAAVLLALAGWLLTGSPALAAPPTPGIESDTVGPGESLTVEVDLVDLEVGDSWELNVRRESDGGLASACHGEGMGVETELVADDPLVFTMETSPNCPVGSRDQPHQLVALRGREVFGLTHSQSIKTCPVPPH